MSEVLSGQYYIAIEDDIDEDGCGVKEGTTVFVVDVDQENVRFSDGSNWWNSGIEEFDALYDHDPEGHAKRAAEVQGLMESINSVQTDRIQLSDQMGSIETSVESTDLMEMTAVPEKTKMALAQVKNEVGKSKKYLLQTQKKLKQLLAEKSEFLAVQAEKLEGQLEIASEAMWTINLYLGKEEEILQLKSGKAADAEEKLYIRQKVLFMDEECQLSAISEGIDARHIDEFDEWLVESDHLNQIIPETKGIVALKPRRNMKDYGDPWINQQMGIENRATYFLVRNGENVYRIWTDLEVLGYLFPTDAEFEEYFFDKEYDFKTHEHVKTALRPGSRAYKESMKKADKHRRNYLRVLLFMQGLFDRTKVFQPLPWPRVNLCDRDQYDEVLVFMRDAEKLLSDGKMRFPEWKTSVNEQMAVGHRIIGAFGMGAFYSENREGNRTHPRWASSPESLVLHTLEDADAEYFKFLYERTDEVAQYDRWGNYEGYGLAKKRASCLVYTDDDFVLDFDVATKEDIEFYLNSSADRVHYIKLLPLLKVALEMKIKEEEEEKDFRLLLEGQLQAKYSLGAAARDAVDELVAWWKHKTKEHRALKSDDAKALRMIVKQYGTNTKRDQVRADLDHWKTDVVTRLKAQNNSAIFIGHKTERDFVMLVAENEENVFVRESVHRLACSGALKQVEDKPMRLVDKRHKNWLCLWSSEKWEGWTKDASWSKVLTDVERASLAAQGMAYLKERCSNQRHSSKEVRFLPLAAFWDSTEGKIAIVHSEHACDARDDHLVSWRLSREQAHYTPLCWSRGSDGLECVLDWYNHAMHGIDLDMLTWENGPVIWSSAENIAQYNREQEEFTKLEEKASALISAVDAIKRFVREHTTKRRKTLLYKEFILEYGDPELWADHFEEMKLSYLHNNKFDKAVDFLVERGFDLEGKKVSWILSEAESRDCQFKDRGEEDLEDSEYMDKSLVVEIPEEDEEDEDE